MVSGWAARWWQCGWVAQNMGEVCARQAAAVKSGARGLALAGHKRRLYIDNVDLNTASQIVALQIANPVVVSKVERLARATGLSKTAVVERAVDRLLSETAGPADADARMAALLAQLDRIPDRPDAFDPLAWDAHDLPE